VGSTLCAKECQGPCLGTLLDEIGFKGWRLTRRLSYTGGLTRDRDL